VQGFVASFYVRDLCKTADAPDTWKTALVTSGVQDWTVESKSFVFSEDVAKLASTVIAFRLVVLAVGAYENASTAVRIASIKFELADSVAVQRMTDYNTITSSALGLDGSLPIQAPFPPVAITGTSKVHNGSTYELQASTNVASAYLAFNKTITDSYQSALTYDPATGLYTGAESTLVNGVAVPGEWIAVKADNIKTLGELVISPTHLSTLVTSQSPRAFTVAAYVNNAWVSVLQRTGIVDWTTESKESNSTPMLPRRSTGSLSRKSAT
jgi:hypothetical protein